jgi:hypothetical protein
MADIIDRNEHVKGLVVAPLETLTIEKNKGTPKREHKVHVSANGISLGLGSSVLIQDHALLSLTGVVAGNVLGTIDIGSNGALALNSDVGLGLLSNIAFTATQGTALLAINASKVNLSGNITGFGAHDAIRVNGVGATSAVWTQGLLGAGTLTLYNSAGTEVSSIGLNGTYSSADFNLKDFAGKNGIEDTKITFVSPDENGFSSPEVASPPPHTMGNTSGSPRDLQSHETPMVAHLIAGSHYG